MVNLLPTARAWPLLLAALLLAETGCLNHDSFAAPDLGGSYALAQPTNVPDVSPQSAILTVVARRKNGRPLGGVRLAPSADTCTFEPTELHTDAQGQAQFNLVACPLGAHPVEVMLSSGKFRAPLPVSTNINVYGSSPVDGTLAVGIPLNQQVVVLGADGQVDTSFRGTVVFNSSDPLATLPAPYTFTVADNGVHTFVQAVIFNTPGTQTVQVINQANQQTIDQTTFQVVAGADAGLFALDPGAAASAGVAGPLRLRAVTTTGQPNPAFVGSVALSSSDANALLPAKVLFAASDRGIVQLDAVTFFAAGQQSIGTAFGDVTRTLVLPVAPGPAVSLSLTGPSTAQTGTPVTVVLQARDAYGNLATGYLGSVQLSSSDPRAVLPNAPIVFTAQMAGSTTLAAGLGTVGTQSIDAADGNDARLSASLSPIAVTAGAGSQLFLSAPASTVAGQPLAGVTLSVRDAFNNLVHNYAGTVTFSSSDPNATLPPPYTFTAGDDGAHTFAGLVLRRAGSARLSVQSDFLGAQASLAVGAASAAAVQISAPPGGVAGQPVVIGLNALDAYGNIAANYAGTLHFSSTDASAFLPPDTTLGASDRGSLQLATIFRTAGQASFTAQDLAVPALGNSVPLSIDPGASHHLVLMLDPVVLAGAPLATFRITAVDAFGNVTPNYTGQVNLSCSDSAANVPTSLTFTAADRGVRSPTQPVTFPTATTTQLGATDSLGRLAAGALSLQVSPNVAKVIEIAGPTRSITSTSNTYSVVMKDAFGNIATPYRGTLQFTSSDPGASLPASHAFTAANAGSITLAVAFANVGAMQLNARDAATPSLTTSFGPVAVSGMATQLALTAPSQATAGVPFTITLSALDANGVLAIDYQGAVGLLTTNLNASLPGGSAFTAASGGRIVLANAVALRQAQTSMLRVRDTAGQLLSGTSTLTVTPGALASIQLSNLITPAPLGQAQPLTVSVYDAYSNLATNYTGTVRFSSPVPANLMPPPLTFTAAAAGIASSPGAAFGATGAQTLTATDSAAAVSVSQVQTVHRAVSFNAGKGTSGACVRFDDGRAKCFGTGASEMGFGDTQDRGNTPGRMGAALPYLDLGTGRTILQGPTPSGHVACALLDTHQVKCWGRTLEGATGLGDTLERGALANQMGDLLPAIDLGSGRTATAVASGDCHNNNLTISCAILDTAQLKCWGTNSNGELGLGDTLTRGTNPGQMGDFLPVVNLGAGRTVRQIVPASLHTCALLDNGQVKCWGNNNAANCSPDTRCAGQLGLGDTVTRGNAANQMGDNLPAVDLGPGLTAVSLAAGERQNCAILNNGALKCWGGNAHGELGLGDTTTRGSSATQMGANLPAVNLGTNRSARQVATGFYHTCALLDDATVKCWGNNSSGQLGQGDTNARGDSPGEMGDSLPAIPLGTGRTAVQVVARNYTSCALLDNGQAKCWGGGQASYGLGGDVLGLGDALNRGDSPGQMGDALPYILW